MEYQVKCEHPTIIVNPILKDLIGKYKNVTMFGKSYKYSPHSLYPFMLPRHVLSPYKKVIKSHLVDGKIQLKSERVCQIDVSRLDECFVVDFSTGETFPVYLQVPCGKCDICKESKITSFVERCRMETQSYDSLPWFVTLTYDDDNLPFDGVRVRDVQLFLKRFRINLERAGFDFKLRYCCSGEYGKTTHRAHYHLILWGLDCFTPEAFERVGSILYNSWDKGYTMHRFIDPKDDKSFYYTAKYLRKENVVPTFIDELGETHPCNDPFFFSLAEMEV